MSLMKRVVQRLFTLNSFLVEGFSNCVKFLFVLDIFLCQQFPQLRTANLQK